MENTKTDYADGDGKGEGKRKIKGISAMPKAVPAILLNILLERFSTTATSGDLLIYWN